MKRVFLRSLALAAILNLGSPLFAANLDPYSEAAFSKVDQSKAPVVLAFHSSSCGTCKKQKPVLDALLKEDKTMNFSGFRVDFDEAADLRKKYRVNSPSTIIVLFNNQEVARSVGETNMNDLRVVLHKGLKS